MEIVEPNHGRWIASRLTGRWGSVTGVTPNGFDSYVRILHSIGAVRWRDVAAATGRSVHPLVQWWRLIDADEPINPTSTIWRGSDPDQGELPSGEAVVLYRLLAGATTTPDEVYFGFWSGYSGHNGAQVWTTSARQLRGLAEPAPATSARIDELHLPGREYVLARGSLSDAAAVAALLESDEKHPVAPNLMWPADRAWFVASEIDFDSTLVGCNSTTAATILANDRLEAYPVGPNDSLQSHADTINT